MRRLSLILMAALLWLAGCGPSQEKRKNANDIYISTLETINMVNNHDSEYVYCMQYLMREIQSPDLKKNKKKVKTVHDSIQLLESRTDTLLSVIATAFREIETLRSEKPTFDIFESADTLLNRYNKIAGKIYPEINKCMKKVSLPVKDSEYTELLKLSYRADSELNAAVNQFNNESAAFYEEYALKDFGK